MGPDEEALNSQRWWLRGAILTFVCVSSLYFNAFCLQSITIVLAPLCYLLTSEINFAYLTSGSQKYCVSEYPPSSNRSETLATCSICAPPGVITHGTSGPVRSRALSSWFQRAPPSRVCSAHTSGQPARCSKLTLQEFPPDLRCVI